MPSCPEVSCSICMNDFVEPQMLSSCGHTFCKSCLGTLKRSLCPVCKAVFRPQDIRPNFALIGMMHQPQICSTSHHATGMRPAVAAKTVTEKIRLFRHMELGVPFGLARLIVEEDQDIALRVFLIDNSGSTCSPDGTYFNAPTGPDSNTKPEFVPCTRWEEIKRMALAQARWHAHVGTPCEFVMLNYPGKGAMAPLSEGADLVVVDPSRGDTAPQLAELERMLHAARPMGVTPLCQRLQNIQSRIQHVHSGLVREGKRFVVVVATDGVPTCANGYPTNKTSMVQVLRELTIALPVFVVIRLCTDEDDVVAYFNKIDEEEELPLEVIDDMMSEARESWVNGNGWLTYSPLIHHLREGGTFVKLFDLLDERKLTPLEVRLLAGHLLQCEDEVPLPVQNKNEFIRQATLRLAQQPLVFDPLRKRMAPCVNIRRLGRAAAGQHRAMACLTRLFRETFF